MRRIRRTEALCLRAARHRESSKLVTLFAAQAGRITCVAKGARRLRSKFGAALDVLAVSNVIYYWHQQRSIYTLSDAQLVRSYAGLAQQPGRFLAAARMIEFLLRSLHPEDPHPDLYRLTLVYLGALEHARGGFDALVSSFLLKAASLLGFRPELRQCLGCGRLVTGEPGWTFDPGRGGLYCPACHERMHRGEQVEPDDLAVLQRLLHTPVAELVATPPARDELGLVLDFLRRHIDPLLLNSFGIKWQTNSSGEAGAPPLLE